MSNIFDALNKGGGEMAEIILPLMDAQNEPAPRTDEPRSPVVVGPPLLVSAHKRPDVLPVVSSPPASELLPERVRTLSLRIAAPSPLLPFEDSHWQASEQYRILRTKISQHPKQPRLLVISSPSAGDGKSVSAVNIAGALSLKSEAKVLLVDADFRRSTVHRQLGLPAAPGLTDVLRGACTMEQALVHTQEFSNLYVMSAGTPPVNPVELLDSAQWPALCARFRSLFRYVVVDSPPLAAVADYDLIQAVCDGIILVVRPDRTSRQMCRKALETVSKAKFLGVVMNCVPDWFLARHASPQYYYYSGPESPRSK